MKKLLALALFGIITAGSFTAEAWFGRRYNRGYGYGRGFSYNDCAGCNTTCDSCDTSFVDSCC